MSVLMSPQDSTTGNNQNCTRFFNKSDFSTEAAQISWDRLKVVCAQPFNKHVPFGLSFVHVRGEKEETAMRTPPIGKIAEEKEEDEIKIGSFFKKKRNSAEGPLQTGRLFFILISSGVNLHENQST